MSPKENLERIIGLLPEDKLEELERIAIAMLPAHSPGPELSFEDAADAVFTKFDKALRNLAQ